MLFCWVYPLKQPLYQIGQDVTCIQPATSKNRRHRYNGQIVYVRFNQAFEDYEYLVKFPGAKTPVYYYPEHLVVFPQANLSEEYKNFKMIY